MNYRLVLYILIISHILNTHLIKFNYIYYKLGIFFLKSWLVIDRKQRVV